MCAIGLSQVFRLLPKTNFVFAERSVFVQRIGWTQPMQDAMLFKADALQLRVVMLQILDGAPCTIQDVQPTSTGEHGVTTIPRFTSKVKY